MSVVVVKIYEKEIIMSADSIIVHGESDKTPVGRGKIFEVNGMLIGSSGMAHEGIHMALFAENHTPLSMDDREMTKYMNEFYNWREKEFGASSEDFSTQFLIAYKGKVFYCNGPYVGEVNEYYSIGAGKDYAAAALYLGHSPAEAVKVACALNCFVSEPIITKSILK